MGVIALSVAAVLVFQFGRPPAEALSLSLGLMCTMVVIHLLFARGQDKGAVSEAVDRLEERIADLDEDVGNLEGRLTGVEHTIPRKTRAEIDPLFAEVEVLGTLVRQMAEAMSDLEARVEEQDRLPPPPHVHGLPHYPSQAGHPAGQPVAQPSFSAQGMYPGHMPMEPAHGHGAYQPQHSAPEPAMVAPHFAGHGAAEPSHPAAAASQPYARQAPYPSDYGSEAPPERRGHGAPEESFFEMADAGRRLAPEPVKPDPSMRELIKSALNANRVELHLQPIVSLPQRQVRYYEAFTRLRDSDGELIDAATFLPEAVRSGLIARIDNLLLFRSVQVIRRLTSRNRNSALFCNISSLSLVDETFFPGFLEFVNNNRNLADALVFEFRQSDIREMGVMERESLSALAELGFKFSVDAIDDMRMDFKTLAQQGFKYAKLHADFLIGRRNANHGHIHPSDFADLLHRYGVALIPDHVETESQVLELLDYEVKLAQGNLFSPPRPVRAEVLQGTPAPAPRRQKAAE
ncbi:EAL domain-containing protein [Roseibium aquae]|nr:EAL domain-containing protein [Roseibium aquae]